MRLVFVEAVDPKQWIDSYKGEMDKLVEAQAEELEITPEKLYEQLVDMAIADSDCTRIALLVDMDEVQLKGFTGVTRFGDTITINFISKNKKIATVDYMPALDSYVRKVAKEWGVHTLICAVRQLIFKHCFKRNFLKNDPVSRKLKHLGVEAKYMIYEGRIGDDG